MPLARTYDASSGKIVTTARDGFMDRLTRWSDIQEYLPFLFETVASYPDVRVLELGTRTGNSTLAFLAAAEAVNGTVTSVDIDRVTDLGMSRWRDHPQWTFVQGDDTEKAVQARLPVEYDVLFIDSSHEYNHTLEELRMYMPGVAPGGIALFHDTSTFGDWDGEDWRLQAQAGIKASVARALDTYCQQSGQTWENIPGAYGLGVIRADIRKGERKSSGTSPVISVLLPTRGRVKDFTESVEGLRDLAADISAIEFLVAADPDDEETITAAEKLGVTLHVSPQRYGYRGLHHYYNYLAARASGEWLFIWNDDCRILTRHWDEIIRKSPPAILHLTGNYVPGHNSFPVLPREWAELLGHLTVTEGVDLWIHDLGRMTSTMRRIPVRVQHLRINHDATAAERDARNVQAELDIFNSPAAQQARWNDAQKLTEFLGRPPLVLEDTGVMCFNLKEPLQRLPCRRLLLPVIPGMS